ncbi:ABC transporter ATP-binding protein [Alkalihalobacillus pseudalcaliphilus]|uniref:ABC transporter ATP-binding protein n=1 Tax=Alkalihalobacillus pseudalcaliphilus TaxID=79884 RepID=UPI00064D8F5E|nr:ABC transporter ATP-binding protein [Alkalihalobacillus pseudalcaliphilus]KMK78165.1 iron ABC transporter ATP-binding protein [Alkalihalobacillus pseudalcaliphilus]
MLIKDISFSYTKKEKQLQNIQTEIPLGKITTIIGPNGSGKSTFIQLIARLYFSTEGEIVLDGKRLEAYSAREFAKSLAVVHQHNIVPDDMTVEKLVRYGRIPHQHFLKKDRKDDERAVEWALEKTQLLKKKYRAVSQLSGGERQRVWIAMALAQQTPILLLDEPTTYLDMYHQLEILDLVKRLNREEGMTIVMVLHDLNQAIRYSDHLLVLKDGQKLLEGSPEDVINEAVIHKIYGIRAKVKVEDNDLYVVPLGI